MAFLTNSLADNKPLAIAIAIIVILLGLALVAVIYRALRGNRIRTSSARGRQQRLGEQGHEQHRRGNDLPERHWGSHQAREGLDVRVGEPAGVDLGASGEEVPAQ